MDSLSFVKGWCGGTIDPRLYDWVLSRRNVCAMCWGRGSSFQEAYRNYWDFANDHFETTLLTAQLNLINIFKLTNTKFWTNRFLAKAHCLEFLLTPGSWSLLCLIIFIKSNWNWVVMIFNENLTERLIRQIWLNLCILTILTIMKDKTCPVHELTFCWRMVYRKPTDVFCHLCKNTKYLCMNNIDVTEFVELYCYDVVM